MRSSQRWVCSLMLAGSWILGASVEASAAKTEADSLFQTAMEQVGRAPVKESLKAFERVLKADRNHAPAHFEMAKLYMSLNTVADRQQARDALHEALRLDPENMTYQLTLGDLLWAQGLPDNAGEQYEKVAKAHPENMRVVYRAGYYCLEEFMRYQDARKYEGRDADVEITGKPFAVKYRDRAISYLERCIKLDPGFRDAYYRLGVVYIESRQPEGLKRVANRLLKQYPGDKDALLFGGLASQNLGALKRAYEFYTEALKRMDSKEREMMESVDLLQSKDERDRAVQSVLQSQEGDTTQAWYDRPEMARFWKKQDPLFLTPFNERRMEHYSRVAYANLRFSDALQGRAGWQTDMGKAWIKYGRYIHRGSDFASIGESWSYEGFSVGFVSDGTGKWEFRGGRLREGDQLIGPGAPEIPMPRGGNFEDFMNMDIGKIFRQIRSMPMPRHVFIPPSRYVDPYRDKKYSLPHQIAAFRERDSVRVELAYAIPKGRLKASGPKGVVELEDGFSCSMRTGRRSTKRPGIPG